jgi:PEGA domain-containing protein
MTVDGQAADTSQGEILLPPGTHHVHISSPGRIPKDAEVAVRDHEVASLDVAQAPVAGNLSVTGTPAGASVVLRGGQYIHTRVTRTLPVDAVNLPIGPYQVTVETQGYATVTRQATVAADQSVSVNVELRKLRPGHLRISASPSDAVISVNGQEVSRNGSYGADVVPGDYRVNIAHPSGDYIAAQQVVQVAEGQEIERSYTLSETAHAKYVRSRAAATVWYVAGGLAMVGGFVDVIAASASSCTASQPQAQTNCENSQTSQIWQGVGILMAGVVFVVIGAAVQPDTEEQAAGLEPPANSLAVVPCFACIGMPAQLALTHRF